MNLTPSVLALYNEIVQEDLLEDRREYDVQLLQTSYELGIGEAMELHELIQSNFVVKNETVEEDALFDALKTIVAHDGMQVKRALVEYIAESEQGSWDGYTASDVASITAFMTDFALCFNEPEMGTSDYFDQNYSIKID